MKPLGMLSETHLLGSATNFRRTMIWPKNNNALLYCLHSVLNSQAEPIDSNSLTRTQLCLAFESSQSTRRHQLSPPRHAHSPEKDPLNYPTSVNPSAVLFPTTHINQSIRCCNSFDLKKSRAIKLTALLKDLSHLPVASQQEVDSRLRLYRCY